MSIKIIQAQTIDYCNRSCRWCPQKENLRKTKKLMTDECFADIVAQAKTIQTLEQFKPFVMNEAFCDDRIFEFIDNVFNELPNVLVAMDSNSDFLHKPENVSLLNKCLENPKFKIHLNVYDKKTLQLSKDIKLIGNHRWAKRMQLWNGMWNRAGNLQGIPTNPKKRDTCFIEWCATINYKGDIMHCCCDYKFESILGNVSNGIMNAYNAEPWTTYRNNYKNKNVAVIPLCSKCNR